ncbi:MAG: elongation factor G [Deltaproteobacteria bacterium]|jgi:elongation factor G|nr:elongation factor G [Deltaproteobacteria bacterium]
MSNGPKSQQLRNIGIIAHIDAGKTTLTERILYYTGRTHKLGEVHDGEATMDFLPEEQARGITIMSAVTSCQWKGATINIIDTPGHVDFTIEVERSLRVLDGAVGVFCAVGGVQPQSETVWRQADRYGVPKLVFVNKLDRVGADFDQVIEQLKERLSVNPLIITRPFGQQERFKGVIDCLRQRFYVWPEDTLGAEMMDLEIPEEAKEEATAGREALLEALVESDDAMTEAYLANEEIPLERLQEAIREATIDLRLTPVFAGAALRNKGVQPLLDGIVDYLPAPADLPAIVAKTPKGEDVLIESKAKSPLAALVFKIQMMDKGRKMSFLRLYSGKLREGEEVVNARLGQKDKVARVLRLNAGKRERIPEALSGDLVGVVGLRGAVTGDTICSPGRPVLLESIQAADPVISVAIEPESSADQEKLIDTLTKMTEEDPTFKIKVDADTGQTVISGMGELHLEVLTQRLSREFGLNPRVGKPQVVYRETVTARATAEGVFERDLAGGGGGGAQPIKAVVTVGPRPRGEGRETANKLPREALVPEKLALAAMETLEAGLSSGPLQGYPLTDILATLERLELGEGSAPEPLVRTAVMQALIQALRNAKPVMMEPILRLEITAPDEFVGEIIGYLQSRLGRVEEMVSHHGGFKVIVAKAPLSELFGYSTVIRSQTQGRGSFTLQFDHFDVVERKGD